jgi:hypothetical protein
MLIQDIQQKQHELDVSIKQLRTSGTNYAQAEKDYKICLRTEALKLRSEKNMPVTLINQIVYGIPEVAELRFKRDVCETIYKANLEAINSIKLQMRILDNQISREWGNAK